MERNPPNPFAPLALALAAGTLLGLPACTTMPATPPPDMAQCNPEAAGWAIGRAPTDDVLERIRVDTGSRTVRVLHEGDVVTMEFLAGRVNVTLNERDAIVGVSCG
jgi:hypothetical protein